MADLKLTNIIENIVECRKNKSISSMFLSNINLRDGYLIQSEVIKEFEEVDGWKLGGTNAKTKEAFRNEELYFGPIFSNSVFKKNLNNIPIKNIHHPLRGEVEIAFVLNDKVKKLNKEMEIDCVSEYITAVHICLEMPWTQFEQPESGLGWLVADLCGTNALVLGSGISWQSFHNGIAGSEIVMSAGGEVIATGSKANLLATPELLLREFLELSILYNIKLRPGQIVATGGATDCVTVPVDTDISISTSGFKTLEFRFNG